MREMPELIAKLPSLHLKGAERVFGVLPKFCISVPCCHVEQQVKDCLVVRREEEAVEHGDAALDEEVSEEQK